MHFWIFWWRLKFKNITIMLHIIVGSHVHVDFPRNDHCIRSLNENHVKEHEKSFKPYTPLVWLICDNVSTNDLMTPGKQWVETTLERRDNYSVLVNLKAELDLLKNPVVVQLRVLLYFIIFLLRSLKDILKVL